MKLVLDSFLNMVNIISVNLRALLKDVKYMAAGTVKWFNNQKGFGFICAEEGGEDIFAHFSAIVMDGYKSLKAGQKVLFEVSHGPKGLHAMNIRLPIEEAV